MKNGEQDMVSINGNFGFFDKKNKASAKPATETSETKETIPVAEGKPQTKEISEARMKELMELEAEQVKQRFNETLGFYKTSSTPKDVAIKGEMAALAKEMGIKFNPNIKVTHNTSSALKNDFANLGGDYGKAQQVAELYSEAAKLGFNASTIESYNREGIKKSVLDTPLEAYFG